MREGSRDERQQSEPSYAMADELERACEVIAAARLLVVATGAGMSRESGIPTFRDAQEGLWARYDPQQLATRQGFRDDPARVWGWYNYRRRLIRRCEPHAGHLALARLETVVPEMAVITQNIDGLHQRAGSATVIELHGNIGRFKCFDRDHPVTTPVPLSDAEGAVRPPLCERCRSPIRPDVVWFGEALPTGAFERAERYASGCDVMLVVGTSGLVYPAAGLPATARVSGATVIEVSAAESTVRVVLPVMLPLVAEIVVVPAASVVARPVALMVAAAVFEDTQVTDPVMSWVELSV